jgi:hemolysin activation/secretion protein
MRKRTALSALALMMGAGLLSAPAFAQVGPGDYSQQQRSRFDARQQELQRVAPPDIGVELRGPAVATPASGACVSVRRIELDNAAHLGQAEQATILRPYAGRCLSLADIDALMSALNAAYISHGFVTSRAYIPQQNLSSGTLRLIMVEGTVAGFVFKGEPAAHHELGAFPGLKGKVLNLRDIEQGLDQMNRLPSWNAKMEIAPGQTAGTSVVIVEAPDPGWLHGQASVNNTGQSYDGRTIGDLRLRADDPFGFLDEWSVEYDHSLTSNGGRDTSYGAANFSAPFGYWTVFANVWASQYKYPVAGAYATFDLSGQTFSETAGLSRVLSRTQNSKLTVEFSYNLMQVLSYLDGVSILTQTENLASLSQRVSYTVRALGGAWYPTIGVQEGLGGLGTSQAFADPDASTPHAHYVMPSIDLDVFEPIPHSGGAMLHSSVVAQYASATLYLPVKMQIGGYYTVRGFQNTSIYGDEGAYTRNEIGWTLPLSGVRVIDRLSGPIEVYLLADGGWTEERDPVAGVPLNQVRGAIAGAGFGLRSTAGPIFWDTDLAHSIGPTPLPSEGWIASFQVGVKF